MEKSHGTGFRVWPDLQADPDLLDPPIRPLVEALNRTSWVLTVFSCAGHPEEPDSVQTGRRQAHIDLLISDAPRWRHFVSTVKRTTQAVRITEGPLGPVPGWLRLHLSDALGVQGACPLAEPKARNWINWLGGPGAGECAQRRGPATGQRPPGGSRAEPWLYRRLVIEPTPYNLPQSLCRQTLDAALTQALQALQQSLDDVAKH